MTGWVGEEGEKREYADPHTSLLVLGNHRSPGYSDADYIGDRQKSPKGTFRGPIFMR